MDFTCIRQQILQDGGTPGEPTQDHIFIAFEKTYRLALPAQIIANYLVMNGSASCIDPGGIWVRFWPIDEWRPAHEMFPESAVALSLPKGAFVCADYACECIYFAVDLTSPQGCVYGLGAARTGLAGADFNEFVARVAADSEQLHNYA